MDRALAVLEAFRMEETLFARLPGLPVRWGLFTRPTAILTARAQSEADALWESAEAALRAGAFVAGYIAYEAAPWFDAATPTKPLNDVGVRLAVYDRAPEIFSEREVAALAEAVQDLPRPEGVPEFSEAAYLDAVGRALAYVRDGDIYQANLTFRVVTGAVASPERLFFRLFREHPVPCAAFVNAGPVRVLSLSPELFLEKTGPTLRSHPMKGTASRALSAAEDLAAAEALRQDPKNRAENVMIADMVRNDFGKICVPGTVRAEALFAVETYATVHQMVSRIAGDVRPGLSLRDILKANFPAPSMTGAPKRRAMEIIRELELSPRGVYSGAIGVFAPNGDFRLNVAIRTLTVSPERAELGVGGGLVADSVPLDEWREALLKSRFVQYRRPDFYFLETLLWERDGGWRFLTEHLDRLAASSRYFGCPEDCRRTAAAALEKLVFPADARAVRVRLKVSWDGETTIETAPLEKVGWPRSPARLLLSDVVTDSSDRFLYHKTTRRELYDRAFRDATERGFDEVLFRNERGEITEGAISNLFIRRKDGRWQTAPVRSGLLPGVWRAEKLKALARQGDPAVEAPLDLDVLRGAAEIRIGNSVRGETVAVLPLCYLKS